MTIGHPLSNRQSFGGLSVVAPTCLSPTSASTRDRASRAMKLPDVPEENQGVALSFRIRLIA